MVVFVGEEVGSLDQWRREEEKDEVAVGPATLKLGIKPMEIGFNSTSVKKENCRDQIGLLRWF